MKNRIKECRQVCGITQTQLAKYAGWTKEQLVEYEEKLPPIFSEFQSAVDATFDNHKCAINYCPMCGRLLNEEE